MGKLEKNGSRQLCLLFPTIALGVGPTARLPLCPPPPSHSPRPPHTFHRHYRQRGTPTGCGDWRRVWRFRGGVWEWRTDSRFECGAIPMGDATKLDPSRCAQERTPARGRGSGTDGDKQRWPAPTLESWRPPAGESVQASVGELATARRML